MDNGYENENSFWSKLEDRFVDLIELVAVLGLVFVLVTHFIINQHRVSGKSMSPSFEDGDYVLVNKLGFKLFGVKRGDIVVFKGSQNPKETFIKRVIGLPGDKVKVIEGKVYIDNTEYKEAYLTNSDTKIPGNITDVGEIVIPDNYYFVLGDNRGNSLDSRVWGPISKDLILGEAWTKIWPRD